jgi:hypothetical protein
MVPSRRAHPHRRAEQAMSTAAAADVEQARARLNFVVRHIIELIYEIHCVCERAILRTAPQITRPMRRTRGKWVWARLICFLLDGQFVGYGAVVVIWSCLTWLASGRLRPSHWQAALRTRVGRLPARRKEWRAWRRFRYRTASTRGGTPADRQSIPFTRETTMTTNMISGKVVEKETGLGIRNLLVVVFDVDPGTRPEEDGFTAPAAPLVPPGDRLGSVLTGPDGAFGLSYEDGDYRLRSADEQRPDLMLLVTGPEETAADGRPNHLLAVASVRQNAGRIEQYLVRLTAEQLSAAGIPLPTTPENAVEGTTSLVDRIVASGERETTIIDGVQVVHRGRTERVRRLTDSFHSDVKPRLRERLSRVPPEIAESPSFVAEGESVAAKATELIKSNIEQIVNSDDPRARPSMRGFVALTNQQAEAVAAQLDADGFISAESLDEIIEPRRNTFVERTDPLTQFARPKSQGQKDMEAALGIAPDGGPGGGGPGPTLEESGPTVPPIAEQDILTFSGRLLSTMTSPEEKLQVDLEPPATQQSVEDSVRNLTFAPSPADVPAFYDFHNLQIAFEHVWQEVIDEGVVDLSEDAFHDIVELGGNPTSDGAVTADPFLDLLHEGRMVFAAQRVVRDHRNGGDAQGGVTVTDTPGSATVRDHRSDPACRGFASTQTDPLTRIPDVLSELDKRLKEDYAFTVYAANRQERSVNFGILITYQQKWEPLGYQAGRLIKTITLAPRETIRYSKKTVTHRKRSTREVENHLRTRREETSSTTRSEQDIVRKATASTNFSLTSQGTVEMPADIGGSATTTTTFQQAASKASEDTKKGFHEAVFKAAQEFKDENTTEVNTEESVDVETVESGDVTNPNDEKALNCMFFELQRRYRVTEQIHRITPVVFVAQEVPRPDEIDEAWLLTHDWILRRTLLDDSFAPALNYLCNNIVGDEIALGELRQNVLQQRCVVDNLHRELGVVRDRLTAFRHLLERSMLRKASGGGGGSVLSEIPIVGDILGGVESAVEGIAGVVGDLLYSDEAGGPTAQDTLKDSLDRTADEERDLLFRMEREVTALNDITEKYAKALADQFNHKAHIDRLRVHVKQNILYYMQAIWSHEPPDQRFFRLHKTPVPVLAAAEKKFRFGQMTPMTQALAGIAIRRVATIDNPVPTDVFAAEMATKVNTELTSAPLVDVAFLDSFMGFKGNYMIFPLRESNALTDYMMHPYVVAGLNELVDPDDVGNWTLEDFATYVLHLKETLSPDDFEQLEDQLTEQYQRILTNPRPNGDEITVSTDSLFIELMPGTHSHIEEYKRQSRKLDVKKQQAEVRRMELESLRYAARLLAGEHEDPEIERKIVVEGVPQDVIVPPDPGPNPP